MTDKQRDNHKNDPSREKNEDIRLTPESIASVSDLPLADSVLVLTSVHRHIFFSSIKIDQLGVGKLIVSLTAILVAL